MKTSSKATKYNNNPTAYVSTSPIHGRGLFARDNIKEGDYIGTYEGKPTNADGMHVLWLLDEELDQWDGIDGSNEMRFLNHSGNPNADFWDADLYALRNIIKDEEITFDYKWEESE